MRDLVALAVGATRETGEATRGRGLRAARLSAIKGDIMGQLDNEELCFADAAVQMLFESEGTPRSTATDLLVTSCRSNS